jgi:hypothetical protein
MKPKRSASPRKSARKKRFFEKKRAKNFCVRAEATPVSLRPPPLAAPNATPGLPQPARKSFFGSFFSKKELLFPSQN